MASKLPLASNTRFDVRPSGTAVAPQSKSASRKSNRFENFLYLPTELRTHIWQLVHLHPTLDQLVQVTYEELNVGELRRLVAKRLFSFVSKEAHALHQLLNRPAAALTHRLHGVPFNPSTDVVYVPNIGSAWSFVTECSSSITRFAVRYDPEDFKVWVICRILRIIASNAEEVILMNTTGHAFMRDILWAIKAIRAEFRYRSTKTSFLGEIRFRVWTAALNNEGEICSLSDYGLVQNINVRTAG